MRIFKQIKRYFKGKKLAKLLTNEIAIAKGISNCNNGCKVLILKNGEKFSSVKWSDIKNAKKKHAPAVRRWNLNDFKENAVAIIERGQVQEIVNFYFYKYVKF